MHLSEPALVFFISGGVREGAAAVTLSNLSGTLGHWFSYFRSSSSSCCFLMHACRFMVIGFPIFAAAAAAAARLLLHSHSHIHKCACQRLHSHSYVHGSPYTGCIPYGRVWLRRVIWNLEFSHLYQENSLDPDF